MEDDHYLMSPCVSVTSPLLGDGMESLAGQSRCAHRWPLWLASAVLVGFTLWTLKAHIGEAIMWLAELAEHAGPWGIVATVLVLAVWVMVLMPISIFEVLVGHVFPLRTAPQHAQKPWVAATPLRPPTAPEARPLCLPLPLGPWLGLGGREERARAPSVPKRRRSGTRVPAPTSPMSLPAGVQALLVCIVGKTLGAVGCFALSQQAKPLVARLMRQHRRLRALERTVHAHPLKATLLVRFSMLPAPVKNYGWAALLSSSLSSSDLKVGDLKARDLGVGDLGVGFPVFLIATLAEVRRWRRRRWWRWWRWWWGWRGRRWWRWWRGGGAQGPSLLPHPPRVTEPPSPPTA